MRVVPPRDDGNGTDLAIVDLDRRISRAMTRAEGVKLSADDLDLLASIGLAEHLASVKSAALTESARFRVTRGVSTNEAHTGTTSQGGHRWRSFTPFVDKPAAEKLDDVAGLHVSRSVEARVAEVISSRRQTSSAPAARHGADTEAPVDPRTSNYDRLIRLPEVKYRTGLSRSTIYRKIAAGQFPAAISLSGNLTAWRESDIVNWIANPS